MKERKRDMTEIRKPVKHYEMWIYDTQTREYEEPFKDWQYKTIEDAKKDLHYYFAKYFPQDWEYKQIVLVEVTFFVDEDDEICDGEDYEYIEYINYPFTKVIVNPGTYECDEVDEYELAEPMEGIIITSFVAYDIKLANGYHINNVESDCVKYL